MERPRLRKIEATRRGRGVSSFLMHRENPQQRLRRLDKLTENAETEAQEKIVIPPGQIKLWPN